MSIEAEKVIAVRTGKTVYRDGNTVLKVFDKEYSKSSILNEALNQARVEEAGICVPKLLEVMSVDGKWALRSEYIKGRTLDLIMQDNPGKFDEYLDMFIDIQTGIFDHEAPLLTRLRDKMDRKINESGLDATTRYELHARLKTLPVHEKICHGDFNPSNVIIKDDGTPCILDWSHVTKGNAAADAARTYLLFWLNGNIDGAGKYLEMYCRKTDTARQYVQKWMPVVAASQMVKGNEKQREFLLSWVNVVDYE